MSDVPSPPNAPEFKDVIDERRVDLHCHSTCSDGTLTPTELAKLAAEEGLVAVSLTDHDNLHGWQEFSGACAKVGVEAIPGVEISATWVDAPERPRTLDILGYFVDPNDDALNDKLNWMIRVRNDRNGIILEKLANLGILITRDEIAAEAGGDVVGRPHIANLLVKKGHVADRQAAFDEYLADDAAAHVPKARLLPEEAIDLIKNAGGCAVVAHPCVLPLKKEKEFRALLEPMVEAGLGGLECEYPAHTIEQRAMFKRLADSLGIIATGGSDFHGGNRPDCRLGRGAGDLKVTYDVVEKLRTFKR